MLRIGRLTLRRKYAFITLFLFMVLALQGFLFNLLFNRRTFKPLVTDRLPGKTIPKIIHQIGKGTRIHLSVVPYVQTWQSIQKDWEYWYWQKRDIDLLVKKQYPWLWKAYQLYSEPLPDDIAMFLVLHTFGGVYAEMDVELLRELGPLLKHKTCVLAQEPPEHAVFLRNQDNHISSAFMAAAPRHYLMSWLVQQLPNIKIRKGQLVVGDNDGFSLDNAFDDFTNELDGHIKVADRKSAEVYVASTNELMPNFDDSQKLKEAIISKCSSERFASASFKGWCNDLKERHYRNRVITDSFTTHHWLKLSSSDGLQSDDRVEISSFVRLVNVTDMILEEAYFWKKEEYPGDE